MNDGLRRDLQRLRHFGIGGAQAMAMVWPGRTHLIVHCPVFLGLSFREGNI